MAELTVQEITLNGIDPTFSVAELAGDTFSNNGNVYLHVKNGDTGSHTITVDSQKKCNFGFDHDVSVTVGTGSEVRIGPFDRSRFNDDGNLVHVSYDGVTSITIAAIRLR